MKDVKYIGNCTDNTENFVNEVMSRAIDITYRTLLKHVGSAHLKATFRSYDWNKPGLHIEDDYAVSFKRSVWRGKYIYIVRHSSIEYFWRKS